MLAQVVEKFEARLKALQGTNTVIRLDHAFSAFSGDVIGRICWEDEEEFLDDPNFAPEWYVWDRNLWRVTLTIPRYNVIHAIVRSIPLFTGFPLLVQ